MVQIGPKISEVDEICDCFRAGSINLEFAAMQRHWEEAFVVSDEVDKRLKELSSVAMLARRDIDRHIWLSECRPDLVPLAPAPPGVQRVMETTLLRKKKASKKETNTRTCSRRGIDDMARSGGSELSDLLRFFSTLDIDLQKLLLEAITKHGFKKPKQKDSAPKDGRKSDQEISSLIDHHQPRQLRRSSCTVRPSSCPPDDESPCSFREWTQFAKQQFNPCENGKLSTEEFSSSRADWVSNSSGRPRGGCGKRDAEDGVCRDVAIQTRRISPRASKLNRKARDPRWEVVDHSVQTSSWEEFKRAERVEGDFEKLREDTTKNILERWAEPLEQYLSTLQTFEQELRQKWLNSEELETTSNSGAQTRDSESPCTQLTSDTLRTSETQIMRRKSPIEVDTQPGKPLSNGTFGDDLTSRPEITHNGAHPRLDNAVHGSEHLYKAEPESAAVNSLPSGPLHGKAKPDYLAAGFRTRKLVEWWPSDKAKSGPSTLSVYDPRTLLGKTKRECQQIPAEKPSVKPHKKPEWWPALRRPYSASEIEAMRQVEQGTAKAMRKAPSKIFTGYHVKPPAQSSNRPQRRKTPEMETSGNQCMAQQADGSLITTSY